MVFRHFDTGIPGQKKREKLYFFTAFCYHNNHERGAMP